MTYGFQKIGFVLLGCMLLLSEPVLAMTADTEGQKATVKQLESESKARLSGDEALKLQIDNITVLKGDKGDKGEPGTPGADTPDRTAELCDLYQHLDNISMLGSLKVPVYCTESSLYCTGDVKKCPDGSYVSRDRKNNCEFFACPQEYQFCGGIAGIQCSDNLVCIDDPSDDCDPLKGGADCGGICVMTLPKE